MMSELGRRNGHAGPARRRPPAAVLAALEPRAARFLAAAVQDAAAAYTAGLEGYHGAALPDSIQLYADCDTGFHCDPAPSVTTYNVFDELFTAMLNYSSPDGTGGWLVADARGRVRINLSVPGTYTTVDQVVAAMVEDEQYGTLEIEHPFPVLIPGTTGLMLQYLNKAIGSLEWDATGTQTFPLVWIGDRFRQINVVRSASGGWVQSDEPCLFKEVDTELEVDNRTYDLSGNHGGITYLFGPGDGP